MSRSFFLTLIIYTFLLAGLTTLRGEFIALSLPYVVYLLIGFWRSPDELKLDIQRKLSTKRATLGEEVIVEVEVTNCGKAIDEILLEDDCSPKLVVRNGSPRQCLSLNSGASFSWSYSVSGPRGSYPFEAIKIRASDHFGVRSINQIVQARNKLIIYPELKRLKYINIRTRRTRVYSGTIPARVGGPGIEFFGLREYQPGDPPRWINWKASARHNKSLFTNEFQQERVTDVGIVLDGRAITNQFRRGRTLFEHSVLAAASLANAFLSQGNRVSLLHYGGYLDWTLPAYGKVQRERIFHALAHAQEGGDSVFSGLEYIPVRFLPAQSQVVLISSLVTEDLEILIQLRARGYQIMVISPDPISFEMTYLMDGSSVNLAGRVVRMERNLMLRKLQRAGIQVVDWNIEIPFDQVMNQRLGPPPELFRIIGGN